MINEFNLKKLGDILRHRLWIFTSVFVLVLATGVLYASFGVTHLYKAEASLIISRVNLADADFINSEYNDLLYYPRLVNEYQQKAISQPILEQVISELSLSDKLATTLPSRIKIRASNTKTQVILHVEDTDPARAAKVANTLAAALLTADSDSQIINSRVMIEKARTAESTATADFKKTVAIAAALGILLGFDLVILLDLLDKRRQATANHAEAATDDDDQIEFTAKIETEKTKHYQP